MMSFEPLYYINYRIERAQLTYNASHLLLDIPAPCVPESVQDHLTRGPWQDSTLAQGNLIFLVHYEEHSLLQ